MTIRLTHTDDGDTIDNDTPNPRIVAATSRHLHGADMTHTHTDHAAGSTVTIIQVMFALFMVAGFIGVMVSR